MSNATWRAHIAQAAQLGKGATTRDGTISSYDPDKFAVKVLLQPDEVETGWMPIKVPQIGAGWGIYAAPQVGDLCTVEFQEDDELVPRVSGFVPNDVDLPPGPIPAGEIWIVHKTLSFLKFTKDGDVLLTTNRDLVAAVGRDLTATVQRNIATSAQQWTHTGPLHVTDNITCDKTVTATTDVVGGGKSLKTHTHGGVQTGSGTSGPPS